MNRKLGPAISYSIGRHQHRNFRAWSNILVWSLVLGYSFLICCDGINESTAQETDQAEPKELISFCAMGDVPRTEKEFVTLTAQLADLPPESDFVVHVGDIKKGAEPCDEPVYQRVADLLKTSDKPFFLVPGDNEWNDCKSPDEAWQHWVRHLMRFERHWDHPFDVERQEVREENFAFLHNGVLFVGVNLVGGRVHDADEWKQRQEQDVQWLEKMVLDHGQDASSLVVFGQAMLAPKNEIFFNGLSAQARKFERPVLYLHGDGHRWINDRPFKERNIFRVQVDAGGFAAPVYVRVTDDPKRPFVFDRRRSAE